MSRAASEPPVYELRRVGADGELKTVLKVWADGTCEGELVTYDTTIVNRIPLLLANVSLKGRMVHTVRCVDPGESFEPVHIFSTAEEAQAFAETDPRMHVISDYVIDVPERMEQRRS